jgi:hypothetical protein
MRSVINNVTPITLRPLKIFVHGCNLLKLLVSHGCSCHTCTVEFCGCVAFDSVSVVVTQGRGSLSLRLSEFKDAKYHHCTLLRRLNKCDRDGVTSSIAGKSDGLPAWIGYDEQTVVSHLSGLLASVQNLPSPLQALNLSGVQRKIIV